MNTKVPGNKLYLQKQIKGIMAALSKEEIDVLRNKLDKGISEYKDIYDKLVEAGCQELPDELLSMVSGGEIPIPPSALPTWVRTTKGPSTR